LSAQSFEYTTAGWTSSLGVPVIEQTGYGKLFNNLGQPIDSITDDGSLGNNYIARINVHLPDGSAHELRRSESPYPFNRQVPNWDFTGTFYAVDGSRMRFDGTANVLYLPDGSRYIFGSGATTTCPGSTASALAASKRMSPYIDRNGNMLNYTASTRQWADTLGRALCRCLACPKIFGGRSIRRMPSNL
jgi:hypothetical protein